MNNIFDPHEFWSQNTCHYINGDMYSKNINVNPDKFENDDVLLATPIFMAKCYNILRKWLTKHLSLLTAKSILYSTFI